MLEARTKVFYGKSHRFSPQFALSCNFLNEGCNGGWPILSGYFTSDFYLPLESCAPYRANTKGSTCHEFSQCEPAVKVKDVGYIGGYYGNGSELSMMKELRSRGPLIADFRAPLSFSYYKQGVFSDDHIVAIQ